MAQIFEQAMRYGGSTFSALTDVNCAAPRRKLKKSDDRQFALMPKRGNLVSGHSAPRLFVEQQRAAPFRRTGGRDDPGRNGVAGWGRFR
jgi:hypothetical protein